MDMVFRLGRILQPKASRLLLGSDCRWNRAGSSKKSIQSHYKKQINKIHFRIRRESPVPGSQSSKQQEFLAGGDWDDGEQKKSKEDTITKEAQEKVRGNICLV